MGMSGQKRSTPNIGMDPTGATGVNHTDDIMDNAPLPDKVFDHDRADYTHFGNDGKKEHAGWIETKKTKLQSAPFQKQRPLGQYPAVFTYVNGSDGG
jgi:hypothetical protein